MSIEKRQVRLPNNKQREKKIRKRKRASYTSILSTINKHKASYIVLPRPDPDLTKCKCGDV